jgi:flagellar biosynthesis/type III secretory pathway M-ring protein FliF/YscJ
LEIVQFLLVLLVLVVAVAVISAPLRRPRRAPEDEAAASLAGVEAAREAKYREIRDAELDFRTGKLSREDWERIDRELRAEAIEILRTLEDAQRQAPG